MDRKRANGGRRLTDRFLGWVVRKAYDDLVKVLCSIINRFMS